MLRSILPGLLFAALLVSSLPGEAHAADPAVKSPPGIDPTLVSPREGEDLTKAKKSLDDILKDLDWPSYLPKQVPDANDPAAAAKKLDARIAELKATLKADPRDAASAAELIQLLVVQKDDPAAAQPYADAAADPKTRIYLPLAAKPVDKLSDDEKIDLALWYQQLGTATEGAAGRKPLVRAKVLYESFLVSHVQEDISRATAKAALLKVHQAIEALSAAENRASRPPSLHSQRIYARARAAWRDGQPHLAINLLEQANRLSPNRPEILRLMGNIYINDVRNPVQGTQYLKEAVAIDPADLDSIFLLGRHEFLHLHNWNNVIVVMAYASKLDGKNADPAIPMLITHYLGRALQNEGYDAAAIEQFRTFLESGGPITRSTRYFQEVALFSRTIPLAWQQIGDLYSRLGDAPEALKAYRQAAEFDEVGDPSLVARTVYVRLLQGQKDEALSDVINLVRRTSADERSLKLLEYLGESGASAQRVAGELKKLYEQAGRPASLALALAKLLGDEQGVTLLQDHVAARPQDREVFERLIALLLKGGKPDAAGAVRATGAAIEKLPAAAERYGNLLVDAAGKPEPVLEAISGLDAQERDKPVMHLLRAVALLRAGKDDEAIEAYNKAAAGDKGLAPAQVALVELLVNRKEYDRAGKLLSNLGADADPKLLRLQVRVLRETGKADEAMRLLNGLLAKQKNNADLLVEKARLQMAGGDIAGAQRTLEEGIDVIPNAEVLYETLFELLDSRGTPDALRDSMRLAERAMRQIPFSRIGRIKRAESLISQRDIAGAEAVLRSVQKDHPADWRSLNLLTRILLVTERVQEADALIDARVKDHPKDRGVLEVALIHYRDRVGDVDKLYDISLKLIPLSYEPPLRDLQLALTHLDNDHPERAVTTLVDALKGGRKLMTEIRGREIDLSHELIRALTDALIQAGQQDRIDEVLKKVVDDNPEYWTNMMFGWAMACERLGRKGKSEELLGKVLDKDPKHPRANNALGYSWADQGKNLDKARKMIQIALDDEPASAAYLDSMGWVEYKLGNFDEAIKWLERSRVEEGGDHPVILDHLGDALYRAGRQIDALEMWHRAQGKIVEEELETDPELKAVEASLKAKVGAMRTAKEPPVAKLGEKPKPEKEDGKIDDEKKPDLPKR